MLPGKLLSQSGELVVGGGGGVLVERHFKQVGFKTRSWALSVMEQESAFAF